jgi:WD40 repeat protein
MMMN